jgi:hypothetical protein
LPKEKVAEKSTHTDTIEEVSESETTPRERQQLDRTKGMLTTCTNTLLRVDSSAKLAKVRVLVNRSKKDGFVLIHSSIGEQEGGVIVGYDGGGRDYKQLVYKFMYSRSVKYQMCGLSL